jgi:hypothetical protein
MKEVNLVGNQIGKEIDYMGKKINETVDSSYSHPLLVNASVCVCVCGGERLTFARLPPVG